VRTAPRLGHDAPVSFTLGLDLHLDLDVTDPAQPIAGRLSRGGGGEIASFSGWMQLTTVLRQAMDEGAAAASTRPEGA
jgi:hypothetical protein